MAQRVQLLDDASLQQDTQVFPLTAAEVHYWNDLQERKVALGVAFTAFWRDLAARIGVELSPEMGVGTHKDQPVVFVPLVTKDPSQ